jgi:imidazolonepropionase
MSTLLIINAKALVGIRPTDVTRIRGTSMGELPMIANGWLAIENGLIKDFGPMETLDRTGRDGVPVIDATGRFVLPGWCDPHTHTVFAAPRDGEFVDRIKGLTYQEIAARGGGILNSAAKLRGMSEDELFTQAKARLEVMMAQGTVAVEIKSGYGLTAGERDSRCSAWRSA